MERTLSTRCLPVSGSGAVIGIVVVVARGRASDASPSLRIDPAAPIATQRRLRLRVSIFAPTPAELTNPIHKCVSLLFILIERASDATTRNQLSRAAGRSHATDNTRKAQRQKQHTFAVAAINHRRGRASRSLVSVRPSVCLSVCVAQRATSWLCLCDALVCVRLACLHPIVIGPSRALGKLISAWLCRARALDSIQCGL